MKSQSTSRYTSALERAFCSNLGQALGVGCVLDGITRNSQCAGVRCSQPLVYRCPTLYEMMRTVTLPSNMTTIYDNPAVREQALSPDMQLIRDRRAYTNRVKEELHHTWNFPKGSQSTLHRRSHLSCVPSLPQRLHRAQI